MNENRKIPGFTAEKTLERPTLMLYAGITRGDGTERGVEPAMKPVWYYCEACMSMADGGVGYCCYRI